MGVQVAAEAGRIKMRLNQYECDECHSVVDESKIISISFVIGREPDPSGNGYYNNMGYKDICQECAKDILREHFEKQHEKTK